MRANILFIFVLSCAIMSLTGYYTEQKASGYTVRGIKADCNNFGYVMLEGEKYECSLVNRIITLTNNDLRVVEL